MPPAQVAASQEAASQAAAAAPKPRSFRFRFFSNAFWSVGGRIASIGSVFAVNVILAKTLSTADFSAYTVAAATVILLAMPAGFGAPRVLLRLIRQGLSTHDPQLALGSVKSCTRLTLWGCALVSLGLLMGSWLLGDAEKWHALRDYGLLVAAWTSLSALCQATSSALQGFDDFRSSATVGARNGGILPNVLVLVVFALAASAGVLSLRVALFTQVALNMIALAWGWQVLHRRMHERLPTTSSHSSAPRTNAASLRWFFHESWPILMIQLTSLGIAQIDMLMVAWLTDERQIAAYGAVARLCEILGASQIMAAGIAAPFVSELYATKQLKKLEKLLRGVATFSAAPTIVLGAVMLVAPTTVLELFGPDFAEGALALQFGVIGCCVSCLAGANSLTMIMAGQQRTLMRVSAVASIAYLCLSPWMILTWGIAGAALTTTLIFGGYNILVTLMIKSRMGVWTVATVSPSVYIAAFREIFKKRSPRPIDP
jgi:O-antigen/teichoic acid export membrane protein